MFVELTKEAFDNFKQYLDKNNYSYSASDVTLPKDSINHIRVDFESVSPDQVGALARQIDLAYGLKSAATETDKVRELTAERE